MAGKPPFVFKIVLCNSGLVQPWQAIHYQAQVTWELEAHPKSRGKKARPAIVNGLRPRQASVAIHQTGRTNRSPSSTRLNSTTDVSVSRVNIHQPQLRLRLQPSTMNTNIIDLRRSKSRRSKQLRERSLGRKEEKLVSNVGGY